MIGNVCVFSRPMIAQHLLAILTAGIILGSFGYVRRDPVQLVNIETSDRVRPGGFIDELVEFDRRRNDCEVTIHAEIVDGQTVHFKLASKDLAPAVSRGPTLVFRRYPVPFAAAWGRGELIIQRTYHCWPFYHYWPIQQPTITLPFEIVPP
mgnify:CR=1 FL=1